MKEINKIHLPSLLRLIEDGAHSYGKNPLFRFERGGVDYTVHYGEFESYVKSIARGLIVSGFGGARVALIGETSVEWIAAYLATVISGGEIVPLDAGLNKDQILNFVNLAECSLFLYSESFAEYIEANRASLPSVRVCARLCDADFSLSPSGACEASSRLSDFVRLGNVSKDVAIPQTDTEKMCALLFTSGTTGSSKGVMLSQKNICAVLNDAHTVLHHITADDVLLSVLPIHHTYEFSCGILAPMTFGASICINDSIKHVTKNLKKYRPTVMALVPLFLEQFDKKIRSSIEKQGKTKTYNTGVKIGRALMRVKIDVRAKLFAQIRKAFGGRLTKIVCGGAALNPALVDRFRDIGITVSQGYGITECAPLISVVPFDAHNPRSCGKIIPHMQVFIDKARAEDDFGEIVVKGDNVMLGYYNNPEATADVLSKGWFYTGDYGYIDENNYLYITGRKKNVIVLAGGKNVFPEEIEEYLESVELIEECVVLGREKDGDVIITALVYPNRTLAAERGLSTEDEIRSRIKDDIKSINRHLIGYKQIRAVEFRDEPFEKTSTRKIKRFTVK